MTTGPWRNWRAIAGARHRPWVRRTGGLALIVVVGLAGAWLGLQLGGHAAAQIGPVRTEMAIQPALAGETVVRVPPLGSLDLASHHGPLRLTVDVQQLSEQAVKHLIADPGELSGLPARAARDLRHGLITVAVRSAIAVAACGLLLGLVVFRRRIWRALAAAGVSLAVLAASGGIAAATWNPRSIFEPRYTGLLAGAPSLVGNVQDIAIRFGLYRRELAGLVSNVTRLYAATSDLPVFHPDPNTIRVLDVSDIHDNPAAWNVMHSIASQFAVNFIIDSGDLTDHGTAPENSLAREIRTFAVPYVFIRGNHDSLATARVVARQPNAVVLHGQIATVDGLRIIGMGDPRFTPDQSVEVSGEDVVAAAGQRLAAVAAATRPPPDIAVVHDPVEAAPFDGVVPLVLAGHIHRRVTWLLPGGTRVFVQGSTGGAGLRALQSQPPTPIECSVLYFDRATRKLQAWDDITVAGLGGTAAQIQRYLATDQSPVGGPVPVITLTPSPGPTFTLTPSFAPSEPSPGPSTRTRRPRPVRSSRGGSPGRRSGRAAGWPAPRTASSTPGMNEARSSESCRMVSVSPCPPSSTSWWATSPASRTECTCTPVHARAPRAPAAAVVVASGDRAQPGRGPGRGDQLRGPGRGAGRGVDLVRVVQLDDLDRLEEPGRLGGELHHQHRADREVRRDQDPDVRGRVQPASDRTWASRSAPNPVVPTTTSRPWPMHQCRLSMTTPGG